MCEVIDGGISDLIEVTATLSEFQVTAGDRQTEQTQI